MSRILVVEDQIKHLEDVKKLFDDRIKRGAIAAVDYSTTLEHAMESLEKHTYNGILSDVFFPESDGQAEEENGTKVGEYALTKGIPFLLVTSTNHHGIKTEPVSGWARGIGMELVDKHTETRYGEALNKEWEGAYLILAYLIEGKDRGKIIIGPQRISPVRWSPVRWSQLTNVFHLVCSGNMEYNRRKNILEERIQSTAKEDPLLRHALKKYCQGMFKQT